MAEEFSINDLIVKEKESKNEESVNKEDSIKTQEELEKEKQQKDKEKLVTDEDKDTEKKVANYYYTKLKDEGVLNSDLEINNLTDLTDAISVAKDKAVKEFSDSLPSDLKSKVYAYAQGLDYKNIEKNIDNLDYYSKIDDTKISSDKKLALDLVERLLKQNGDDEEYIQERLKYIEDTDTHELEGKRALKKLKEYENKVKQDKEQAEQDNLKKQENDANNFKERLVASLDNEAVLWNTKLGKEDKEKILMAIYEENKFKTKFGVKETFSEIASNPETIAQLYYLYIKGALGKQGKLDFIENRGKNKGVKEIDKLLNKSSKASYSNAGDEEFEDGLGFIDSLVSSLRP